MIHHVPERRVFLIPNKMIRHIHPGVLNNTKIINFKGDSYLVIGDDLHSVRLLSANGVIVPSPILREYRWSGNWTPFEHQYKTSDFMVRNKRSFIFNDIGTGKTQSALWAIDYLQRVGDIKSVLISAPLSILESVWGGCII